MAYEQELRMRLTDRKTEKGTMLLRARTLATEAELKALTAYSGAGFTGFAKTSITNFAVPQDVTTTAALENDKDFKAILGFQGAEGHFKIVIPAPKINVEGGIVIRWGANNAFVPATKETGETGDDGATIQAKVRTLTGDTTVTFVSGRIYKRP